MVGGDGGKPDTAPVSPLHSPHPLHGVRVDSSHGRIQRDSAEHFDAGQMFAYKPGPVRGGNHMILENHAAHAMVSIQLRALLIVQGTAEDIGAAMEMRVNQV